MPDTAHSTAELDQAKVEAFVGKCLGDFSGTMSTLLAALGDRLGLFKDLAEGGPATSAELGGSRRGAGALRARVASRDDGGRLPRARPRERALRDAARARAGARPGGRPVLHVRRLLDDRRDPGAVRHPRARLPGGRRGHPGPVRAEHLGGAAALHGDLVRERAPRPVDAPGAARAREADPRRRLRRTSAAAPAGPRSPTPRPTRTPPSSASTPSRGRSRARAGTPRRPASATASASSCST